MRGNMERRSFLKIAAVVTGSGTITGSSEGSITEEQLAGIEVVGTGGEVRPGDDTTFNYKLKNTRQEEVRNVKLSLGPPLDNWERQSSSPNRKVASQSQEPYFAGWQWNSIAPGETIHASYNLSVPANAEKGEYTVFAELTDQNFAAPGTTTESPPPTNQTATEADTKTETDTPTETTTTETKTSICVYGRCCSWIWCSCHYVRR